MSLDINTHKNILIKILKDIYTDSSIGPILGFKGGTATYLFYELPRFSVDLDFDLLDFGKEDYDFQRIGKILQKYGTIKESVKKRFNLFWNLSYKKKVEGAQNIKVEINRRDFGSKYEIKSFLGISMKVMVQEDIFAHKLVAMSERIGKTNRDIFDTWYFLQNDWPINKELIENRTKMSFKDFIRKCIVLLENKEEKYILFGMGELLDEKTKNWVRKNLKKDTLFLLKLKLESEK